MGQAIVPPIGFYFLVMPIRNEHNRLIGPPRLDSRDRNRNRNQEHASELVNFVARQMRADKGDVSYKLSPRLGVGKSRLPCGEY